MRKDASIALAERLDVGLSSHGVCPACLGLVAFALDKGEERKVAGQLTQVAPFLWDEGLGDAVRFALETAARGGDAEAGAGLRELDRKAMRSPIFRAVVRRLAAALREEVRRAGIASRN